ncbi:hypothetical protein JTE90_028286 [Oedothorax gibbosus]|uniref:Uncharacterized protein n=1 Tax=Oedothorax gibbosus TaxID=931172 RepID=A0AAV6UD13_9ARAC|nr:hypothetical protein JTE90_028286 [Oedothorax gibbosus]
METPTTYSKLIAKCACVRKVGVAHEDVWDDGNRFPKIEFPSRQNSLGPLCLLSPPPFRGGKECHREGFRCLGIVRQPNNETAPYFMFYRVGCRGSKWSIKEARMTHWPLNSFVRERHSFRVLPHNAPRVLLAYIVAKKMHSSPPSTKVCKMKARGGIHVPIHR